MPSQCRANDGTEYGIDMLSGMAKRVAPGWYDGGGGEFRWHDGSAWTDERPPENNPRAQRGWYWRKHKVLFQWWTGRSWGGVFAARDGRHDVVRSIGEAIVTVHFLGGGEPEAIAKLYADLADWPPVRVKTLHTRMSMVASGVVLVATVEWDGPKE